MACNLQMARAYISVISSFLFGLLVSFFSKAAWIRVLKYTPLGKSNVLLYYIIAFPILALSIVQTFIGYYEIYKGNSNFITKDCIGLAIELIKTIQTIISLSWDTPLLLTAPAVIPISLVIVMAIDAGFHFICLFSHILKCENRDANEAVKQENRLLAISHAISFVVSILTTIGLGLMFLSGIGPAALLPIGIITAIIIVAGGIASVVFNLYLRKKTREGYQRIPGDGDNGDDDEEQTRSAELVRRGEHLNEEETNRNVVIHNELRQEGGGLLHRRMLHNGESSSLNISALFSKTAALHLRNTETRKPPHILEQEWPLKPSAASPLFFKEAKNSRLNTNKISGMIKLEARPSLLLLQP